MELLIQFKWNKRLFRISGLISHLKFVFIGLLFLLTGCENMPFFRVPMDGPFKYRFNPIYEVDLNNIIVDLEGDESIYYIQYLDQVGPGYLDKFCFIIRDQNYKVIDQINIQGRMSIFDFFDWNNDGVKELWIVYENNDSCFVQIINSNGKYLLTAFSIQEKLGMMVKLLMPGLGEFIQFITLT